MDFKRFSLLLAVRILLIIVTCIGLIAVVNMGGYATVSIVLFCVLVGLSLDVYHYVTKTNRELSRFLDAARYADFSQRFELTGLGAGFDELGNTLTDILRRFHDVRAGQEAELKYIRAMVEHVPVPLIVIQRDQQVKLLNNSARRLFGNHHIAKLSDLAQFGPEVINTISNIQPGERQLLNVEIDGMAHQLSVATTQVVIGPKKQKLISLQDIQSELDKAKLKAWQDLVRVLTHEIMNSITPIASLASTAKALTEDAKEKSVNFPDLHEDLEDLMDAVGTVARRSDGLMNFVSSYRQLTRLPEPNKKILKVEDIFNNAQRIATLNWSELGIKITTDIQPQGLEVSVDPGMIEQVLINLLKNAQEALAEVESACVTMSASLNKRGHVVFEIEDNGPGISDELRDKIFVPFFTTKKQGTGVGLALTRQIMIAHGGNAKIASLEYSAGLSSENRGCKFVLTF